MQKKTNNQWAAYVVGIMSGLLSYSYFNDKSRGPASYENVDLIQLTEDQNKKLPLRIDPSTTLTKTEFTDGKLKYSYIVTLTKDTFDRSMPAIVQSIEKSICEDGFTGMVLSKKKHPIVYSYTDFAGNYLGQHEVVPEICLKKSPKS